MLKRVRNPCWWGEQESATGWRRVSSMHENGYWFANAFEGKERIGFITWGVREICCANLLYDSLWRRMVAFHGVWHESLWMRNGNRRTDLQARWDGWSRTDFLFWIILHKPWSGLERPGRISAACKLDQGPWKYPSLLFRMLAFHEVGSTWTSSRNRVVNLLVNGQSIVSEKPFLRRTCFDRFTTRMT